MPSTSRGVKNKNPLNIRIGNDWIGEVKNPTDPEFEQFTRMEYGLRAGFKILRRYIRHYHRDTVAKIIQSWAPASENETEAYISHVCALTGFSRNRVIFFEERRTMVQLVSAMCKVECGTTISTDIIETAYNMIS